MKNYALEIKWGIIFTVATIAWVVVEKMAGWHDVAISNHALYTNLFILVTIVLYFLALRAKRRQLGDQMTWKEGFIAGAIITVVATLLSPVAQLIAHFLVSPDYFSNAIEYAVESGNSTRAEAVSYFNLQNYLMLSAVGTLIFGLIASAVVAFFVRNRVEA